MTRAAALGFCTCFPHTTSVILTKYVQHCQGQIEERLLIASITCCFIRNVIYRHCCQQELWVSWNSL